MKEMTDNTLRFKNLRKSFDNLKWIIPLISGLILIASLIIPAGHLHTLYHYTIPWWGSFIDIKSVRFWIWGLWNYTNPSYDFNRSYSTWLPPLHLSIGIMFAALIFIIGLLSIILANKLIRKKSSFEEIGKLCFSIGILLLIICVSWIILVSFVPYYDILATLNENLPPPEDINALFWTYFRMDFGIIGPFIASGLLIIIGRFTKR
jgi:hypothetical protein